MDIISEYKQKLRTPEEAVKVIKDGDWVDYTTAMSKPVLLDRALAARAEELHDVKIRGNLINGPIEVVEQDTAQEHFTYNTWHCSGYERKLCDKGLAYFMPMVFHNNSAYYHFFLDVNVAMTSVTPMDKHGFFNFSLGTGVAAEILRKADIVILEVNEHLPRLHGGYDECIHISDVDFVVEGEHEPFKPMPKGNPTDVDMAIAKNILPFIIDGATLQLGIGNMPNTLGTLIADSDIKDLGMHTELCSDGYLDLYKKGKLTNKRKTVNPGKAVTGITIGSPELYEWMDDNPMIAAFPLEYVNNPRVIGSIDNMISINSCISVDLYGQVNAESSGTRQISGTGGQLDFLEGASISRNGKSFICLASTYKDKEGKLHSNILPHFSGEIITSPRSQVYYIATEYGAVNMEGMSSWQRAEKLISIAHPEFRDALIKAAEEQRIWRRSNKR
ncbi:MAG: butyryl-CoA:acetate CoA-transferase [Eubacteriaceae bacterium]|jgi:butyryl-CoA:acetate CoA-transferase|nr:butyryl-CoA:acetate CoA-transferase [Eubacteriaceae bacterium]